MSKLYKRIKTVYENFATLLFIGFVFCILLQIFARYVIKVSVPWTEELARYIMIIVSFLGAAIVSRKGDHLGAYFIRDKTKGRVRGLVYTLNSLVVLGVLCLMFQGALKMRSSVSEVISSVMPWFGRKWLYDAALVGITLMIIYGIRDLSFSVLTIVGKMKILENGKSSPMGEKD